MAKVIIAHACGHEQRHELYGPSKERGRKEIWLAGTECTECWKATVQADRAAEAEAAAVKSAEYEMPTLQGSEKQVAWANTIRMQAISKAEADMALFFREAMRESGEQAKEGAAFLTERGWTRETFDERLRCVAPVATPLFYEAVAAVVSCREWIDNAAMPKVRAALCPALWRLVKAQADAPGLQAAEAAARRALEQEEQDRIRREMEAAELRRLKLDAEREATLVVDEARSPIPVVVEISGNTVSVTYPERDEVLMQIGIEMGFVWIGGGLRELYCRADVTERAAEAVCRLLAAGFSVRCMDAEIREKGRAGEYAPRVTRRIKRFTGGKYDGWFAVHWERGAELYDAVKRIRGTVWAKDSKCAAVRAEMWPELVDFAGRHGFEFSEAARALVEERKAIDADPASRVKVPSVKKTRLAPPPAAVPAKIEVPEVVEAAAHLVDEG